MERRSLFPARIVLLDRHYVMNLLKSQQYGACLHKENTEGDPSSCSDIEIALLFLAMRRKAMHIVRCQNSVRKRCPLSTQRGRWQKHLRIGMLLIQG
jgi:hypothetical protein